tara:strand:+ start:4842 stop:5135 length:294 start_codon:yes stop_codon:yes gene_type:complete
MSGKFSIDQREIWARACLRFKVKSKGFEIPTLRIVERVIHVKLILVNDIKIRRQIFPCPLFVGHSYVALAERIYHLSTCGIITVDKIETLVGHIFIQ